MGGGTVKGPDVEGERIGSQSRVKRGMTKSAPTMYFEKPQRANLTEGGIEKLKVPIHKYASVSKGPIFLQTTCKP
jgi:hypothetical protein